ncbi:MAG TPA: L,D-transpeptidase family protein [Polyangiaceae bacterium]|nr:L,D-transpeptidase family protein [Polyangiaceae bacterium]
MRFSSGCLALCLVFGCGKRTEPPGAAPFASAAPAVGRAVGEALATGSQSGSVPAPSAVAASAALGSTLDNLPFDDAGPEVVKVASIAWRSWIYTDTGPNRTRYGYLRAGAIVSARGPKLVNDGCEGGWYRINPRGFICLGLGATLDLQHPVVVASQGRPVRSQALPYTYGLSSDTPPLLYFRLPSAQQMSESEGGDISVRAANHRQRLRASGLLAALGELGGPPPFLGGDAKLPKPYGVKQPLRYVSHAGAAAADSGFAIAKSFEWEKRLFGLTTELDVIALDRVKLVKLSEFYGIELAAQEGLPVAFSKERYGQRFDRKENGDFGPGPVMRDREGVKLTGQSKPGGFLETRDGTWVSEASMRILQPRDSWPSFVTGDRKWIDISIKQQSLVAYAGKVAVYATLVSTGRAGLGDPDETESTPRGTFMIYQKEVASTMDGDEDKGDSYNLRDVPFVQYFHKGYALHGAYWHDEFGKVRSHGCINLAPRDAAWLFEWTDPSVPQEWHGVLNKERGTVVYIHP